MGGRRSGEATEKLDGLHIPNLAKISNSFLTTLYLIGSNLLTLEYGETFFNRCIVLCLIGFVQSGCAVILG